MADTDRVRVGTCFGWPIYTDPDCPKDRIMIQRPAKVRNIEWPDEQPRDALQIKVTIENAGE